MAGVIVHTALTGTTVVREREAVGHTVAATLAGVLVKTHGSVRGDVGVSPHVEDSRPQTTTEVQLLPTEALRGVPKGQGHPGVTPTVALHNRPPAATVPLPQLLLCKVWALVNAFSLI